MGTKETTTANRSAVSDDTTAGFSAGAGLNQAVIIGQIVAQPERRTLPSGSIAASFSLTVRTAGHKTTSVPIVWYDPPKRIESWRLGEMVAVRGSVVRRFSRGAAGLGSSTEVVVEQGQLIRHRAKTAAVLSNASGQLVADA